MQANKPIIWAFETLERRIDHRYVSPAFWYKLKALELAQVADAQASPSER